MSFLDKQGNIYSVIGTLVNISQQKALEKQLSGAYKTAKQNFQQIIDNLDTNVYWKNRKGIYLGCNNKIAELSDVNSVNKVISQTDYDFSPPNIADRLMNEEEQLLLPSGQIIGFIAKKSPILDDKVDIRGIVGVSIDITDCKKLEEETKRQKKELEEKDRLKRLFVKNFSHDAKAPFESIVGATQLLIALSKKHPEFNKMVENIDNNAIKYSKIREKVQVKLAVKRIDAPKSKTKIRFTVSDTVISIAEEDEDKIYGYGRRLVKFYRDNISGIGLGLHMVKNHVDVLGSALDCHSELGKGTRFDVELTFDEI